MTLIYSAHTHIEETTLEPRAALKLINLARASYGAPALNDLCTGEPHRASWCLVGMSLRVGVEDWLFTAVGTKFLRIGALDRDSMAIAKQIVLSWLLPIERLSRVNGGSRFVTLPLPAELGYFVDRFDHGGFPQYRGKIDLREVSRLKMLVEAVAQNAPLKVNRAA